jgi:ABC-type transporter Mla subunit MlaD
MRRTLFLTLGLLELAVAILLACMGSQLPGSAEVERSFESAGRVTDRAGAQVSLLRQQVQTLRRMELQQLAGRLQRQTETITATLRTQPVDFDTIGTMRDALGEVAKGLSSLADTLDPANIGKLSKGLGETAAFIDEKVVPASQQAADRIDQSTTSLRADADRLSALLKDAPLDLKVVREVYDSLGRFQEGLDKMNSVVKLQRLDVMREGFRGMEDSLQAGSDEVERLASYTYPVVTLSGLKPQVSQRSFWPQGGRIAEGMRKAAAGATAAGKEMDALATDLPKIRSSLEESSKMVTRVRDAMGMALKHQDKVEPLLKEAPLHAARLAEQLPKIGGDLARVLRDTDRLKEIATALRQAQKALDSTLQRWPELRTTLKQLAKVLKATRDQLNQAVKHRHEYEEAMNQTVEVAETFAAMLPLITDQLDYRLDEEERTLTDLGQSLDEVGEALPAYAHTTARLLWTGKMLAWLVASIVGLHGCYLALSSRLGRRFSF